MLSFRRLLPVLITPVLVATMTGASSYPPIVQLPVEFAAEGIAVAGHTLYAGSLLDGDIYRSDLRTGDGSVFIDVSGRAAAGLAVDTRDALLFVAGGFNGHAYVYDSRTGADVADYTLGQGQSLVNDVVVTRDAAYFTETFAARIYKVPIVHGAVGPAQTIAVTGPASATGGFGLNGIDVTPDGSTLIVAHSDLGQLFTVDPVSGASRQIALTSGSLIPGMLDGILLAGHDVWVVENFANRVAKVHLSDDWTTGAVTTVITNPAFQVPTGIDRHGSRLEVVNGKFDLGFPPPLGPGAPPGTPFEVVQFQPE